jgi:hypothetical protein
MTQWRLFQRTKGYRLADSPKTLWFGVLFRHCVVKIVAVEICPSNFSHGGTPSGALYHRRMVKLVAVNP